MDVLLVNIACITSHKYMYWMHSCFLASDLLTKADVMHFLSHAIVCGFLGNENGCLYEELITSIYMLFCPI